MTLVDIYITLSIVLIFKCDSRIPDENSGIRDVCCAANFGRNLAQAIRRQRLQETLRCGVAILCSHLSRGVESAMFSTILRKVGSPRKSAAPAHISLDEFFERHYIDFAASQKKSARSDLLNYRKHISPCLGSMPLNELTTRITNEWLKEHREKALKETTVNKHVFLLNRLIGLAVSWGFIDPSRTVGQRLPRIPTPEPPQRHVEPAVIKTLISCARRDALPVMQYFISLLSLTGARKSEWLHARWRDISEDGSVLNVAVSKNGRPRIVALSRRATHVLEKLRNFNETSGLETLPSSFLFANPRTGRPYRNIDASWFRIRDAAGLPNLRLHDLRHSYATMLINNDVSIYDVQQLLGHKSIQVTQRYAKVDLARLTRGAEVVGALLK